MSTSTGSTGHTGTSAVGSAGSPKFQLLYLRPEVMWHARCGRRRDLEHDVLHTIAWGELVQALEDAPVACQTGDFKRAVRKCWEDGEVGLVGIH